AVAALPGASARGGREATADAAGARRAGQVPARRALGAAGRAEPAARCADRSGQHRCGGRDRGDRLAGLGTDHAGAAGGGAGGTGPHQRERAPAAGDRGAAGPHRHLAALSAGAGRHRPAPTPRSSAQPREGSDSGNAQASGPVASSWGESASGASETWDSAAGAVPSAAVAGSSGTDDAPSAAWTCSGVAESSGESASGTSAAAG